MKQNYKTVFIFAVFIAIFTGSMLNASNLKIAINISPSDNKMSKKFYTQFNNSLKKEILDIENFSIISRSKLIDIVSWTDIDLNDCDQLKCIKEVGRLSGADFIVAGFVTMRTKLSIDIYIVEVSQGKIIASESFHESERTLRKGGMNKIAKSIVSSIDYVSSRQTVEITSAPAGAVVALNNKALGETPITVPDLRKRNEYSLLFHKQGYESLQKDFTLDEQKMIHVKLIPQKGSILISGHPFKAKVYINNKYAGKFPQIDYQNFIGTYSIMIEKPGYNKYQDVFEITSEESKQLKFHLKPKPKLPAIALSTVIPGSGQIVRGFTKRGLLFLVVATGVGYLTAVEYMDYDSKHTHYLNDLDRFKNQTDLNMVESDKEKVLISFDEMKKQETVLNNYLYAVGAVWSINILEISLE